MFAVENGLKGDPRLDGISEAIRVIPHFPKPGIMFQDITTLLLNHKAFKDTVDIFVDRYRCMDISVVAGIEARGFMFGPSIALAIGAKFVPLRKPRKLPGEVISEAYVLEYGTDCLEMHVDAVQPGERAVIIDDIVATGGTLSAAIRLLGRPLSLSLSLSLMALVSHLCFSHPHHLSSLSSTQTTLSLPHYLPQFLQHHPILENQTSLKIRATGGDMLGDFGARDPFPAEVESGFADKVLGNFNTEHRILIPNLSSLSLSQQDCTPVSPLHPPISRDDAQKLLKKVVGWRLLDEEGGLRLQCLWKLRDFKCGVELINRIYRVVEVTGHFPNLHLELPNQVRAELWTASIGGLSMNDFIVAAKIDEIKTSDLVPKKRIWA